MSTTASMWRDGAEDREQRRFADESVEELEDEEAGTASTLPEPVTGRVSAPAPDGLAGSMAGPASAAVTGTVQRRGPQRYLDRQVSWLDFNSRVLDLAEDPAVPLLDRVRFVAIFARNLDEFFMVRVAALRRRVAAGISAPGPTGATPKERLARVSEVAQALVRRHSDLFTGSLAPELAAQGLHLLRWDDLTEPEVSAMRSYFQDRIHPVLTPLAVDPAHPFPYISGLSLNLAVVVCNEDTGADHFARVKVPPLLPRLLTLDDAGHRLLPIEEVITAHLDELFPGMNVLESSTFRVTRNEDLEVEADVENLLHALERELSRRRFGAPVRLEIEESMSQRVLDLLVRELDITKEAVYRVSAPLDLTLLDELAALERPDLNAPGFVPATPPALRGTEDSPADIFAAMRQTDVLLHHPYDSFAASVQAFIEQAGADPDVHAIKLTLYRTSGESPIVDALVDAARSGKQVLVVVEIKARFDEQANIRWARELEQAGCHVVYGLVGLKTHCKLALVVRMERDGVLRRYVHVGTGNYNPKTARIYEDLGLLTADAEVGSDVADLFNHLSGYTRHRDYDRLLVAPDTLRSGLRELIATEARNAAAGEPAGISIKCNSLVDEAIIDALYDASAAGVPVRLLVRGMCSLRPGVPGLSDTIEVRSILGRFLEHSRVYRFGNGGHVQTWIGSADLMDRNLDRRVEALVRVTDKHAVAYLDRLLDLAWAPNTHHWTLGPDGRWTRVAVHPGLVDLQQELIKRSGTGN